MKLSSIRLRDPFILSYQGRYYLYGTGIPDCPDINEGREFWCYVSDNLKDWNSPVCVFKAGPDFWGKKNFWAPEVHELNGKFHLLASFLSEDGKRKVQSLLSSSPTGPFLPDGKPLTPEDWMSLDGTLFVENGKPYLVYCHEWVQVQDGEIVSCPLNKELNQAAGENVLLFRASESGWAETILHKGRKGIVTDGPFLIKDEDGLYLFWSSFHSGAYAVGIAVSESGLLSGPWKHQGKLLFEKDGGHGMVFRDNDGNLLFLLHQPNGAPLERPHIYRMEKENGSFVIKGEIDEGSKTDMDLR